MPELILYTTSGCHLCEQAEELLLTQLTGFTLRKIDISDAETMVSTYGLRIPVLGIPGTKAELDWPFNALDVADYLDAHC
ncbi:MAG: glutaredoxin family protein [Pseudomonadales bacterium]|nr:glutaredoxin family protein [Pseudomonadales bacterium]